MTPQIIPATGDQIAYLKRLSVMVGQTDLQVCARVGKTDYGDLTKAEASRIIGILKQGSERPASSIDQRAKFHTPLGLRRLAESDDSIPADIDEHAKWVVEHLRLAIGVRKLTNAAIGEKRQREGINRGGDIKMSDLLKHFRSWDELAKAFDVTVPTAKAWGEILPAARAYEAEVKTEGFVTAPRRKG